MPENNSSESTQTAPVPKEPMGVVFSPEQFEKIQSLADKQGINPAQAIVQAIDIADIVVDAGKNDGQRVLIQTGDQLQELTLK